MKNNFLWLLMGWLGCLSSGQASAQGSYPATFADSVVQARNLYQSALSAQRAGQLSRAATQLQQALRLHPDSPRVLYALAAVQAQAGNVDSSLVHLHEISAMGLSCDPEQDTLFRKLWPDVRFKAVVKQLNAQRKPIQHGKVAFTLPQKDLITEGIAYYASTNTFYVSSIHHRKIVGVRADGQTFDLSSPQDSLWSVQSLVVDPIGAYLWASSSAFPQMAGYQSRDKGKTALYKYDLQRGRLLKRYLPADTLARGLGDIARSPSGELYAADRSGAIYRFELRSNQLERWLSAGTLLSPQGMCFSADNRYLFVADYAAGIIRIDKQTKEARRLAPPHHACLLGMDGLYFHQGNLIAIQNGTTPVRLLQLHLNTSATAIDKVTVLESAHPLWNEPTLGVLTENGFYYIGNSQWNVFDEEKGMFPPEKLQSPVILRLNL